MEQADRIGERERDGAEGEESSRRCISAWQHEEGSEAEASAVATDIATHPPPPHVPHQTVFQTASAKRDSVPV